MRKEHHTLPKHQKKSLSVWVISKKRKWIKKTAKEPSIFAQRGKVDLRVCEF